MGVNVNEKVRLLGTTALHEAAKSDLRFVQILVEAGADVNAVAVGGATSLSIAQHAGKEDIVKYLEARGAAAARPRIGRPCKRRRFGATGTIIAR
jgi:ankyrin repeat protein